MENELKDPRIFVVLNDDQKKIFEKFHIVLNFISLNKSRIPTYASWQRADTTQLFRTQKYNKKETLANQESVIG